jgi:TRAP-type C4-dicarboxylate transport system permease small subunit
MRALVLSMRPVLDKLYLASGVGASLFLITILLLISAQMVARWSGAIITGAPDYTGYAMAAASFLGLPYALNKGAHIRVSLLLNALGRYRRMGEIWCFAIGSYLSVFFAYYAIKSTRESLRFNDISQGQDASPIWIPQIAMCIGTVILAIAFIDHLLSLLFVGDHNIKEDSLEAHAE